MIVELEHSSFTRVGVQKAKHTLPSVTQRTPSAQRGDFAQREKAHADLIRCLPQGDARC
jgi:hypothetical protein